ncbi:MAG TPA: PAS domain S-box protein, partial [Thermoanaerobaculia bacterium]|nr:PAS domain S-box protein [Thermoanaerobaculia bacterium]
MTDNPAMLSERDRALFETSPDGILIANDDGIYVDVNDALCAMLQTPREQLVGRPFVEFMPPDRIDDAIAAFAQLRATGALALEFPLLRSDGTQINLEWRSRANFLPGLYLCVAHDLTEREEAERALRESDERYRAFMANTTEAIWRFELEEPFSIELPIDEQIDLCYERAYLAECNDAMARMYGFASSSQIVGMRIGDMLVRDNPDNVAYLRTFMESGYHLSGAESQETDRDGNEKVFVNSLVGIIVDGHIVRAWGMQRDATEEKQLERQRAALVSRLELLADVTAVLGSSLDYDQTLRSIAGAAVPRFADWCFIDVVTESGAAERVVVQHSDAALMELASEVERRYPSPADIDIGPRHTIRTGATQTYEIRDEVLVQYAQNDEHLEMARALGFHNGLVV